MSYNEIALLLGHDVTTLTEEEIIRTINMDAHDLETHEFILRHLFHDADEKTYKRIKRIIENNDFLSFYLDDLQPVQIDNSDNWHEKEQSNDDSRRFEKLVALNGYDEKKKEFIQLHSQLFVHPQYFIDGRNRTFPEIYLREGVVENILSRLSLLPPGYGLKFYDGFRTGACQKDIYDEVLPIKFQEEKKQKPAIPEKQTKRSCSIPLIRLCHFMYRFFLLILMILLFTVQEGHVILEFVIKMVTR